MGQYFAVDEETGEGYLIDWYTFPFQEAPPGAGLRNPPRSNFEQEQRDIFVVNKLFQRKLASRVGCIMMIYSWCHKHPKKYYRVLFPFSWAPSPLALPFLDRNFEVPFRDLQGRCRQVSAANAPYLILVKGWAENYWSQDLKGDRGTSE